MVYPCECKVASVHSTCSGPLLIEALFSQLVEKSDSAQLLLYSLGLSSGDEGMCKCLEIFSGCKLPVNLPTYLVHQHLPFATFFSKLLVLGLNVCERWQSPLKEFECVVSVFISHLNNVLRYQVHPTNCTHLYL